MRFHRNNPAPPSVVLIFRSSGSGVDLIALFPKWSVTQLIIQMENWSKSINMKLILVM